MLRRMTVLIWLALLGTSILLPAVVARISNNNRDFLDLPWLVGDETKPKQNISQANNASSYKETTTTTTSSSSSFLRGYTAPTPERHLQDQCSALSNTLEQIRNDIANGIPVVEAAKDLLYAEGPAAVLSWFAQEGGLVSRLLEAYLVDAVDVATGAVIRGEDQTFPEVCQRLPLKDEDCYISQDGRSSFFANALAAIFPIFGDEIKAAYDFYAEAMKDIEAATEEVRDFFLPDREPRGSCFAVNQDMIGIADNPGFPDPLVYEVCNCVSVITSGVPACTVQPYFRGFALSQGSSNALEFDSERLGEEFTVYDGYVAYKFRAVGDLWIGMDVEVKIPKLAPNPVQNLICVPAGDAKPPRLSFPDMRIRSSLFFQSDLTTDGELLLLAAIESIEISIKAANFAEVLVIELGAAVGMIRVRSEDPECTPSGIFVSALFEPKFNFGEGFKQFLRLPQNIRAQIQFGATWKDRGEVLAENFVQSFFFRFESSYELMGISVDSIEIEIQFFNEEEFARRRNFDKDICCTEEKGITDCATQNSALDFYLQRPDVTVQPTLGLFLRMQDISFFEILIIRNIEVEFIYAQSSLSEFFTRLRLAVELEALFVKADAELIFEITDDGAFASFSVSVTANVGLGTLQVGVDGFVGIGDYLYPEETAGRQLQQLGGSFLDADWDLDFFCNWEFAQWLEDLGRAIVEGLKIIADAIVEVWNAITDFVSNTWNFLKNLAQRFVGAIKEFFENLDRAIDEAQASLTKGVEAFVAVLDGAGLDVVGDIVGVVGDAINFVIDVAQKAFEAAKNFIVNGIKGVLDFFNIGKTTKDKRLISANAVDEDFGCPLFYYQWRECISFFFDFSCSTKRSADFPEESCYQENIKRVELMATEARFARDQDTVKEESEARNQGLKWVAEDNEADVREQLGATMQQTKERIGKTSELGNGNKCRPLPYVVDVGKLSEDSLGTAERVNAQGVSENCVDYTDLETLSSSLEGLQSDVAEVAKEASRGNQGVDKDPRLLESLNNIDEQCITEPQVFPATGYGGPTVTVKCTADTAEIENLLGPVRLEQDARCSITEPFVNITRTEDPEDGCLPTTLEIERSFVDCCLKESNVLKQTLVIEPVPPRFTDAPGSLDLTLDCKANIHPDSIPSPSYEPGCRDAAQSLTISDSDPIFDVGTCETVITRQFRLVDDGCDANAVMFQQDITLVNNDVPEWDHFPPDVTIDVFAGYGTEVTGFPTAFQPCGASPVIITYTDEIRQGNCRFERVIERTFTAEDVCGHVSERTQLITISNVEDLPLGEKSLAQIYGRNRAAVSNDNSKCIWPSDECGVTGTPHYPCKSGKDNEFAAYQAELNEISRSLALGPLETSCACSKDDITCDERARDPNYLLSVFYGVPRTFAAGTCTNVSFQQGGTNEGQTIEFADRTVLSGSDAVYNIFVLEATDFEAKTIKVDAPPSSIVLVNVQGRRGMRVKVGHQAHGIELAGGLLADNVLWNFVNPTIFKLSASTFRRHWYWHGAMLNPMGAVTLTPLDSDSNVFKGQLFAGDLNSKEIAFECSHFIGFAACQNLVA